jgi:tetratricopeptide (TPR) repeat protein
MGLNLTLGTIYMDMGNLDDALSSMMISLSYNPNSPDALVGVSNVYAARGDYAIEKQYAEKAIAIDPMRTVAYMSLSNALFFQGQYADAEQAALKALDVIDKDASLLSPDKSSNRKIIYRHLSQVYAAEGDSAKSAEYRAKSDAM